MSSPSGARFTLAQIIEPAACAASGPAPCAEVTTFTPAEVVQPRARHEQPEEAPPPPVYTGPERRAPQKLIVEVVAEPQPEAQPEPAAPQQV